jgi:GT2 family glycosyltransferase
VDSSYDTVQANEEAAVVLHYQAWPEVRETLDGLFGQTRQPDEILVVDHASGDGSDRRIEAEYPDVQVVAVEEKRGPAAGANHMLRAALGTGGRHSPARDG